MGTRKHSEKQEDIWIAHTELASAPAHPFYQRLNELLEATTLDQTLSEAGMAVAELVGREAERRPDEPPKVNVRGIEEEVTDKGYHAARWWSGSTVTRCAPTFQSRSRRGDGTGRVKLRNKERCYQNRRRVRGEYGKQLNRRRFCNT